MIGLPRKKRAAPASGILQSPAALIARIERGLPFPELELLQDDLAIPLDALAAHLGIARATLHRRKLLGRLTPDESDKVVRYSRLLRIAIETLGDLQSARQWLGTPQLGLGERIPLEYARTEAGAREVEALLGRIEYGVYS
jgi:putative toxin-antitoxin system antitoxin component (TIGR02293 family)